MELEESTCLISDYTTELQSSRQHGTGTKKYRSMEQNRKPRGKSTHTHTLFLIKEARIYNGEKTISLTSGTGKTGQLPVKD